MKTETPTTTSAGVLESLRVIPPGKKGEHRGSCASCGLHLWSEGGYRVPGLQGLFCSLLCMECAIAEKTGQTKKIPGAPIGNGARLLAYLKTEAPQVYAKLTAAMPMSSRKSCLECGVPLDGKQNGAQFCSDVHRMRFRRSETAQKNQNRANTPIAKQGLTNAQNGWSTDTLTRAAETLEMPVSAISAQEVR